MRRCCRIGCAFTDGLLGQLGDGTTKSSDLPVPVKGLVQVRKLSVGFGHACAIRSDHALFCWGDDAAGDLGNNSLDESFVPSRVLLVNVTQVAAGERTPVRSSKVAPSSAGVRTAMASWA